MKSLFKMLTTRVVMSQSALYDETSSDCAFFLQWATII